MSLKNIRFYEFDKYRADVHTFTLSYEGRPVRITKKAFDLLLLLLENSDREVSRNEIMEKLWSPTADPNNLDQYLSKLRTLLGDKDEAGSEQKNRFIKTFPSQGIKFVMPVIEVLEENQTDTSTEEFNVATSAGEVGNVQSARRKLSASLVGFIAVAILLMTGFVFWQRQSQAKQQAATDGKQALPSASLAIAKNTRQEIHSPSDEEAVKKVVKDSQLLETLGFYEHPEQFDAELLKKYWLPEESGGKAIAEVHKSIKRLLEKKYHYGSESKNEVFEIRTVRIFSPRDYAEVSTVEQWFVPIYNEDGSREINRNARLGPYTVDYTLHKIEGVWLLEENSTPRASQYVIPTPTVAAP